MSQIIYTIAAETHECYGHGDYGTEQRIIRLGFYATGSFPPCFHKREQAENYLKQLSPADQLSKTVIPLELY